VDLGPLLNAHAYLTVERPPHLWEADCDDRAVITLLGEMIVAALVRGTELADVVLRVNNITVEHDEGHPPGAGDFVGITILGRGDWAPEVSWDPGPGSQPVLVSADLDAAARDARARWAYVRSSGDGGSVTVFFPRLH
jgi:hypothetical protein